MIIYIQKINYDSERYSVAQSCSASPISRALRLQSDYESFNVLSTYVNYKVFWLSVIEVRGLNNLSSGGFPGGAVVENLPANARDTGSSPGLGRSHMPRSN